MHFLADVKLIAEKYIHNMSIWDVGLLKFCLGSLGILVGTGISSQHKKAVVRAVSWAIFILSYLYLVSTFVLHFVGEVQALLTDYEKDF